MFIDFRGAGGGRHGVGDRERERERENENESEQHWFPPMCTVTGNQTCNPGLRPDQESNPQHFGVRINAQTN